MTGFRAGLWRAHLGGHGVSFGGSSGDLEQEISADSQVMGFQLAGADHLIQIPAGGSDADLHHSRGRGLPRMLRKYTKTKTVYPWSFSKSDRGCLVEALGKYFVKRCRVSGALPPFPRRLTLLFSGAEKKSDRFLEKSAAPQNHVCRSGHAPALPSLHTGNRIFSLSISSVNYYISALTGTLPRGTSADSYFLSFNALRTFSTIPSGLSP